MLAMLLGTQGGCMCVHIVKNVGVHETSLHPVAFWTNACGDSALECTVVAIHLATHSGRDFGVRYIYATRDTWQSAVIRAGGQHYGGPDRIIGLEPSATLCTNTMLQMTNGFWLVPGDVKHKLTAKPPDICPPWSRAAQSLRSISCAHYSTVVDTNQIEVAVCMAYVNYRERRYKTGWWWPAQILLAPAYVVDVITAPIQFFVIMHRLSGLE